MSTFFHGETTFGQKLGLFHFYRNRGANYTDGFRTSLQAGLLGAGVARGAGFTDTAWAIMLGASVMFGLEFIKVIGGWLDHRLGAIDAHSQATGQTNPYVIRQTEAQEAIRRDIEDLLERVRGAGF